MPFLIALQFLTIVPITLKGMPTKKQNAQSLLFHPFIGIIIGLILFSAANLLSAMPIIFVCSLLLVIWIVITGGLHLDGLADTADAWVGGLSNREKTLSIMKDPNCGPIGILSLIIVCLLKFSSLYVLLEQQQYKAIVLIPMLGRLTPLFLLLTTEYVRRDGLGESISTFIPRFFSTLILIIGVVSSAFLGPVGILTAVIMIFSLFYLRHKFIKRIGGITGDTIGASIEIIEVVSLLSFVILMFYLPHI